MIKTFYLFLACCFSAFVYSQNYDPQEQAVIKSDRQDGRFMSTYGIVQ